MLHPPLHQQKVSAPAGHDAKAQNEQKNPPNTVINNVEQDHPLQSPTAEKQPSKGSGDTETGFFIQLGLLAATFAIAVYSAIQANASKVSAGAFKSQIALMSDTAQRELRAYVNVASACIKFVKPGVPEGQVHYRNYGKTPAYNLETWIGMAVDEYPRQKPFPPAPPESVGADGPLPPGRQSIQVVIRDPPLPDCVLPHIGTRLCTVYIYGEIRYTDAFGIKRFTKYRLMHGGLEPPRCKKEPDGTEMWLLKPCSEGNECD